MKTKILLFVALLIGQILKAQSIISSRNLDSLSYIIEELISDTKPTHTYIGNIYMLVVDLKKGAVTRTQILNYNQDEFDTIEVKSKYLTALESKFKNLKIKKDATIISPFIFIENPKKGANGNSLVYDLVVNNLFSGLFKITNNKEGCIVLPISLRTRENIVVADAKLEPH